MPRKRELGTYVCRRGDVKRRSFGWVRSGGERLLLERVEWQQHSPRGKGSRSIWARTHRPPTSLAPLHTTLTTQTPRAERRPALPWLSAAPNNQYPLPMLAYTPTRTGALQPLLTPSDTQPYPHHDKLVRHAATRFMSRAITVGRSLQNGGRSYDIHPPNHRQPLIARTGADGYFS